MEHVTLDTGETKPAHPPAPGRLSAVSEAVRQFLASQLQAREIRLTRIAALPGVEHGWEAEAEILVPDLAIQTLGLPLTQQVLERRGFSVHLDQSLDVIGYESLDDDG
jgi:hypothetical protein